MAGLNNLPDKTALGLPSEFKQLADFADMMNMRDDVGEVSPDFESMSKRTRRASGPMSTEVYPILDK